MSSVSAPSIGVSLQFVAVGKNGLAGGGGSARQDQKRYTPLSVGKFGCSAIPSNPRSDALLTARSKTVPCTTPFRTRLTWPVFFSITKNSFSPIKATAIGVTSPDVTVRVSKFGTTIVGSCAPPSLVQIKIATRIAVAKLKLLFISPPLILG